MQLCTNDPMHSSVSSPPPCIRLLSTAALQARHDWFPLDERPQVRRQPLPECLAELRRRAPDPSRLLLRHDTLVPSSRIPESREHSVAWEVRAAAGCRVLEVRLWSSGVPSCDNPAWLVQLSQEECWEWHRGKCQTCSNESYRLCSHKRSALPPRCDLVISTATLRSTQARPHPLATGSRVSSMRNATTQTRAQTPVA